MAELMRTGPDALRLALGGAGQMRGVDPQGDTLLVIRRHKLARWREVNATLTPAFALKDRLHLGSLIQERLGHAPLVIGDDELNLK